MKKKLSYLIFFHFFNFNFDFGVPSPVFSRSLRTLSLNILKVILPQEDILHC